MKPLIICSILVTTILIAYDAKKIEPKSSSSQQPAVSLRSAKEKTSARTNSRDSEFSSFRIDSSKNGYGAFFQVNSPLAYSYDANGSGENSGWVAVYRQLQGIDESAGFLGVAQSDPTGEEWLIDSRINTKYPENQTYPPTDTNGDGVPDPLPTEDQGPGARYPSAVISSHQNKPTAIWNEYTLETYGGGTYGGVPMYSYDYFGLNVDLSNFSSIQHLNEGCINLNTAQGEVCDPPDLWQANVQLVDGGYYNNQGNFVSSPTLLAMYTSWATDARLKYMIRSVNITNGYISVDAPSFIQEDSLDQDAQNQCLWRDCGDFTGTPDFHVNTNGVGYMGMTSFAADSNEVSEHTIFFKKTVDYGLNWTSEGGLKNSGYYYLPDDEYISLFDSLLTLWSSDPELYDDKPWYPDAFVVDSLGDTLIVGDTLYNADSSLSYLHTSSFYLMYEHDIMTDHNGGLHFVINALPGLCRDFEGGCDDVDGDGEADSIFYFSTVTGAGMYHFYNANPTERPYNWRLNFLEDFSDAYYADWDESGELALYTTEESVEFYFYPNIRPSYEDGSEVIWYASTNMSSASWNEDETLYLPSDIDLFMAKSVNNGRSWTVPENVTNTTTPDNYGFPQVEYGHHLANIGSDTEIGVFYQMPNFRRQTVDDGIPYYYDYVNWVNVGKWFNDLEFLSTSDDGVKSVIPSSFTLKQNYPNPFNPLTIISYKVDRNSEVNLSLYDIRGAFVQNLINERINAGSHNFEFNASHLSSGVYFYTMTINNVSQTKKLVIMK